MGKYALPRNLFEQRFVEFETILKMHALLGDSICISDVQLIGSSVLLLLFADDSFRSDFLSKHPDFLRLIARRSDSISTASDRLARVYSGLGRILSFGNSYIPNTFSSAETVPHVAKMFSDVRSESDAERLFSHHGSFTQFVRHYPGADRNLVVGLYRALEHFLLNELAPVPEAMFRNTSSYFEELEKIYAITSPANREVRQALTDVMALATTEAERFKRTLVLAKLPQAGKIGHPDRVKYLTMIQAWNVAVGRSIGADYESAYCFREAFPIPVHSGFTSDLIVRAAAEDETIMTLPRYDWHPSSLNWKTVAKIREELKTPIDSFQDSLRNVASTRQEPKTVQANSSLEKLNKAAVKIIAEDQSRFPATPPLLAPLCATVVFGVNIVSAIFGIAPPSLALQIAPGAIAAYATLRSAVLAADRNEIGNALQAYGLQYNLYRQPEPARDLVSP